MRQGNRKFPRGWEGWQTPLHKAAPKFIWHKFDHNNPLQWLDISDLERQIRNGSINPYKVITLRELYESNTVEFVKTGLAMINRFDTQFKYKIHLEVIPSFAFYILLCLFVLFACLFCWLITSCVCVAQMCNFFFANVRETHFLFLVIFLFFNANCMAMDSFDLSV